MKNDETWDFDYSKLSVFDDAIAECRKMTAWDWKKLEWELDGEEAANALEDARAEEEEAR
jgi:hypothetical protein